MTPFLPQGPSVKIAYADDSTDTSVTLTTGAFGMPNCLLVVNPDGANVVAFNYSFDSLDTNASVPTSGANGRGVIILPGGVAMIRVAGVEYNPGNLYVSVAGDSATGNVFITPGVL